MSKTIRCTVCRSEFTDEEIQNASCCPSCAATGIPQAISNDVTITLNIQDLRILGIWAENYAASIDNKNLDNAQHESLKRTVHAILAPLEEQLTKMGKPTPLSMTGEMKQIREMFPKSNATLFRDGVEEVEEE